MNERNPRILAIDAGGTMTDTFIVDTAGDFVVGKARSTPEDESLGLVRSAEDALSHWGMKTGEAFPLMVAGIYSGTVMLNRLLSRNGLRLGVIVSKGQEDYFLLERGVQTYLGFSYSDRLHVATHYHNRPIVPKSRVRGVFGRIDIFGEEVLPLQEEDVGGVVAELLDQDIEGLCVCLLNSYRNPVHEQEVGRIAAELMQEIGKHVPLFLSSEYYPLRNDLPRLNTTVIEAYAAEPSRGQLKKVSERIRDRGGNFDVRVMAAHGGMIGAETRELARTLISGPIGGVVGAKYLARHMGHDNVVCTDVGGTSFDLALVTEGACTVKAYPDMARFLLSIPMIKIDSMGAGTGSYVRVNPNSARIEIGPDSAGASIGVCWPDGGVETATITDCSVVLGVINPDYFLGGEMRLDRDRAIKAVREQVAKPLNIGVYEAASGVVELLEENLKGDVLSTVLGKGYSPANYVLLSYGGGGPVHVAGYTRGLGFADVIVPAWAAGFSAFGCACADFEYRYEATTDIPIAAGLPPEWKSAMTGVLKKTCEKLKTRIEEEFHKTEHGGKTITYKTYFRIQYMGQLDDLEILCPPEKLETAEDLDALLEAFEDTYGRVYALAAKSPELGYAVTQAVVTGMVEIEKPVIPEEPEGGKEPDHAAWKEERPVFWSKEWIKTGVWDMPGLRNGNVISGPAIIESPATTFAVPPDAQARLDAHRLFHLEKKRD